MTILNNVNVGRLAQVIKAAEADKSKAKRTHQVASEWLLEADGPQFKAEINFEGGKIVMESNQPTNLGSGGHSTRPITPLLLRPSRLLYGYFCCHNEHDGYRADKAHHQTGRGCELFTGFRSINGTDNGRYTHHPTGRKRCPAVFALTKSVKLNTSLEVK